MHPDYAPSLRISSEDVENESTQVAHTLCKFVLCFVQVVRSLKCSFVCHCYEIHGAMTNSKN